MLYLIQYLFSSLSKLERIRKQKSRRYFVLTEKIKIEMVGICMDIREMEYFVAVCKYNSILKASKSLYITQQALSKSMKNLETTLGVQLFNRGSNSISLTEAGVYLYKKTSIQLERHYMFLDEVKEEFRTKEIVIRLGVVPGALRTLGADVLMDFFELNKGIKVEIIETYDKICEQMIREKQLDIAISTKPIYEDGLLYTPIKSEQLLVIAHKDFPLLNKRNLSFEDLRGIPVVLCDNNLNLHSNVVAEFQKYGLKPNIVFQANEIEIMIDVVAKGKAINICAEHVINGLDDKEIVGIPLCNTAIEWEIGTLIRDGEILSKEMEALLELIR